MINFMDGIVEGVTEFVNSAGEQAVEIAELLLKIIIAIATPIWILPYMLIRRMVARKGADND